MFWANLRILHLCSAGRASIAWPLDLWIKLLTPHHDKLLPTEENYVVSCMPGMKALSLMSNIQFLRRTHTRINQAYVTEVTRHHGWVRRTRASYSGDHGFNSRPRVRYRFWSFSEPFQANAGILPRNGPRPLHYASLLIQYSLFILSFDSV
jgi:hypothetical protein